MRKSNYQDQLCRFKALDQEKSYAVIIIDEDELNAIYNEKYEEYDSEDIALTESQLEDVIGFVEADCHDTVLDKVTDYLKNDDV